MTDYMLIQTLAFVTLLIAIIALLAHYGYLSQLFRGAV